MEVYLHKNPQVTFSKNVYRRYTKFNCWKSTYTMETNTFDLTELIKEQPAPVIIKDMWLDLKTTNLSPDTNVSLVLVPEYEADHQFVFGYDVFYEREIRPLHVEGIVDWDFIDEYERLDVFEKKNENTLNLNELENFQNLKKTRIDSNEPLDGILSKKNTYLLSKLSIQTAQMLGKYLTKDFGNYLNIPVPINSMVFNLIQKSKYRLFIHIDKVIKPVNLIIKFSRCQDDEEIRRFGQVPHEYLLKRYIEVDANIDSNNTIKCNYTNMCLAGLVLYSEKKLDSVKIKDRDGIEHYLTETSSNPENTFSSTNGFYYVATQLSESQSYSWNVVQPVGSYIIGSTSDEEPNNPITFETNTDISSSKIKITYVIYDVLRYYTKNFVEVLSYTNVFTQDFNTLADDKFNELVNQEEKLTKEQFAEHFYSWVKTLKQAKPMDHFQMDMKADAKLHTYYDYVQAHDVLFPQLLPPPEQQVANMEDWMDIPIGQIPLPPIGGLGFTNSNLFRLIQLNEQTVTNLIKFPIRFIENIKAQYKPLETNTICEISLENIKWFETYYCCPNCSGNFRADIYRTWIEDHTKSGKCPKCQKQILTMPGLKINSRINRLILYGIGSALLGLGLIGISKYQKFNI